ncbi:MAG: PemK-like protein [Planctomycetes bacterium ADurb.Bin126]|nr:MAG: PemK-like protein [Planctomycetes bacterium ADurb.Bin126]HOD82426.1 type II toxin-antitoxin system PemK/MazF family toxin [Phycisphaerae bacterium]HQL76532.1 type II toxin-antitoxin system PemK/MazF family toxin [Phycisphaerae bacterium]
MSDPLQGEMRGWDQVPDNHPMGDKNRMWVIVSRDAFNRSSSYVLACPITSYPPTQLDITVPATPHNPLSHQSAMLVRMITPILKRELGPALGRLGPKITREVACLLRTLNEVV